MNLDLAELLWLGGNRWDRMNQLRGYCNEIPYTHDQLSYFDWNKLPKKVRKFLGVVAAAL
jgi:hypothetical protein